MAVTQFSSLNSLFNTIYDRAIFVARETNLMTNLVDNRSATGWMNRIVPTRPQITAVAVGETEDFNAPTTFGRTTQATLTPSEIMAQVVLTDRAVDTDPDSVVDDASMELGAAIATKIDVDLVGLFSSFTTDIGDGAAATATIANMAAGVSRLRAAYANQYGPIFAVWHPYHWHDFWVELGQPAATYPNLGDLTNEALRQFWVSDMLAMRHFISNNIAVDASDDAVSGMFVRRALMLDTRRPARFETERDASARAWELNISAGYAVGVIQAGQGMAFTADAAAPS